MRKRPPTLASWAPDFLAHVQAWRKPRTYHVRRLTMARHILPELGALRLDEIDSAAVDRLAACSQARGLAPRGVISVLDTLASALRLALERGHIQAMPPIRRPGQPVDHERYLSVAEELRLLDACPGPRELSAVLLGLRAGLRRSEIAGLPRRALELPSPRPTVRIVQQVSRGYVGTPKGSQARTIPLHESVAAALIAWGDQGSPWVFPGTRDPKRCLSEGTQTRMLIEIVERARIADCTWHTLRHTFASRLVERGVHLRVVQALLGHSSIKTTERYAHVAKSALDDAIQALG